MPLDLDRWLPWTGAAVVAIDDENRFIEDPGFTWRFSFDLDRWVTGVGAALVVGAALLVSQVVAGVQQRQLHVPLQRSSAQVQLAPTPAPGIDPPMASSAAHPIDCQSSPPSRPHPVCGLRRLTCPETNQGAVCRYSQSVASSGPYGTPTGCKVMAEGSVYCPGSGQSHDLRAAAAPRAASAMMEG